MTVTVVTIKKEVAHHCMTSSLVAGEGLEPSTSGL